MLLLATGFFWGVELGYIQKVWEADVTYITTIITIIFMITSFRLSYKLYHNDIKRGDIETGWFISEQVMALGMLGTVIGLVHMLSVNFEGLTDAQNSLSTMGLMFSGLGVALYTNAAGLIASLILKFQIHFLFGGNDE